MKISDDDMSFIRNVVKTAQIVDIDNIIIENGLVRAMDDNQTVVMLQNENVPEMPFGSIGLNRINFLLNRLSLVEGHEGFVVDAKIDGDNVSMLSMRNENSKVEYRCANPSTIRAPRQINDTTTVRVQINADAVVLLQRASAAMPQNNDLNVVTFTSDGKTVAFELTDASNDTFTNSFSRPKAIEEGNDTRFAHRYPLKTILALFKTCPDGFFEIGQKGILKISINGLDIYVPPQV